MGNGVAAPLIGRLQAALFQPQEPARRSPTYDDMIDRRSAWEIEGFGMGFVVFWLGFGLRHS